MAIVREETTFAFLQIPGIFVVCNVILCCLLSLARKKDEDGSFLEMGRFMISLMTTASISIVTLTFSLTVLSIQIAAQAYSPRLLDEFLRDPLAQLAIGVNLGAYAYGFVLTYFLNNPDEVPHVAIHVLSVHMGLILIFFVLFIHHFVNGFRLETILHQAAEDSWRAACALERLDEVKNVDRTEELPDVPKNAYKVLADQSGYVAGYRLASLKATAIKLDLCIRYHPNIGEFVAEGTLLAYVWDASSRSDHDKENDSGEEPALHQARSIKTRVMSHSAGATKRRFNLFNRQQKERVPPARHTQWISKRTFGQSSGDDYNSNLDDERLTEERLGSLVWNGVIISAVRDGSMDVLLGVQTLTDIAVKALSAAINDPMTAVQALDFLSSLFCRLTALSFSIQCIRDSNGVIRACAPRRSFSYILSVPDAIRSYGGSDLNVLYRIMRFYGEVGSALKRYNDTSRITPILAQLEQCLVTAQKNFDKDSLEYKSIQEVYEYSLELMIASDGPVLGENEAVEKDLTDLETTFVQPTDQYMSTLPPEIQKVAKPAVEDSEEIEHRRVTIDC